jgi:hypothetical protein
MHDVNTRVACPSIRIAPSHLIHLIQSKSVLNYENLAMENKLNRFDARHENDTSLSVD